MLSWLSNTLTPEILVKDMVELWLTDRVMVYGHTGQHVGHLSLTSVVRHHSPIETNAAVVFSCDSVPISPFKCTITLFTLYFSNFCNCTYLQPFTLSVTDWWAAHRLAESVPLHQCLLLPCTPSLPHPWSYHLLLFSTCLPPSFSCPYCLFKALIQCYINWNIPSSLANWGRALRRVSRRGTGGELRMEERKREI